MKIIPKQISIRDLVAGYKDIPSNDKEDAIFGYKGKLNIRPAFQRAYVYDDDKQKKVITSIFNNYPLNVMYWIQNSDGNFELLDGQQRTISICKYFNGKFAVHWRDEGAKPFHALNEDAQKHFLNYKVWVYFCIGGNSQDKIDWFKTINISGEQLEHQEVLNAINTGPWLSHAKQYFSCATCEDITTFNNYLTGERNRQRHLETALKWIVHSENLKKKKKESKTSIEEYMSYHKDDNDANELINYFKNVFDWVRNLFPKYYNVMKGLPWGEYYNEYKKTDYDKEELTNDLEKFLDDEDITNEKGIFIYLLSGKNPEKERHLNIRTFDHSVKKVVLKNQGGRCANYANCQTSIDIKTSHADHIKPWRLGGKTEIENCQVLCPDCNARKGGKY